MAFDMARIARAPWWRRALAWWRMRRLVRSVEFVEVVMPDWLRSPSAVRLDPNEPRQRPVPTRIPGPGEKVSR